MLLTGDLHLDPVERCTSGNEEGRAVGTAESDVRWGFRNASRLDSLGALDECHAQHTAGLASCTGIVGSETLEIDERNGVRTLHRRPAEGDQAWATGPSSTAGSCTYVRARISMNS